METVQRIEPARLEEPGEAIGDVVAELSAASATLARALHPRTAANLATLVRVMNAYYSIRGEFERGEIARITGLPERSARRVLGDVVGTGLLASDTPKGPVSLRFPVDALDVLFPRLFPQT